MTKHRARPKRAAKRPEVRHFDPTRRASTREADDLTARLNAVYGARPDSELDPVLSELQARSLRDEW